MDFEWNGEKADANFDKHGVTFSEAASAFADDHAQLFDDPEHSDEEERAILIGMTPGGRLLIVSYVLREGAIRIISARLATPAEARIYTNV